MAASPVDPAHRRQLVVWDVPPAIERGARFSVKLGVRCDSCSDPEGWSIEIRDHDGRTLTTATLGVEPWPDTTAVYAAEVELRAPEAEGLHAWQALAPAIEPSADEGAANGHAHGEVSAHFNVRTVAAPECRLTVVAIDRANDVPIQGVRVTAHPYRAVTDARGTAELSVAKGTYRVFVSGRGFLPFRHDAEVKTNLTIRAELVPDIGPSDAELWP